MSLTFSEIAHAHKEFIQHTLQSFEEQLHPSVEEDAELVTRAMFTVRNHAIKPPYYSRFGQFLVCQIQDVGTTEVSIHFEKEQITCSCQNKDVCRHKLAIILKLSQYFISLQQWLQVWRSPKTQTAVAATRSPESWQKSPMRCSRIQSEGINRLNLMCSVCYRKAYVKKFSAIARMSKSGRSFLIYLWKWPLLNISFYTQQKQKWTCHIIIHRFF